jgi:hypothetical protein
LLLDNLRIYQIFDQRSIQTNNKSFPKDTVDEVWGQRGSDTQITVLTFCKLLAKEIKEKEEKHRRGDIAK